MRRHSQSAELYNSNVSLIGIITVIIKKKTRYQSRSYRYSIILFI